MKIKFITAIGYTFFVALISALLTVLYYHVFVFKTFSHNDDAQDMLRKVDSQIVANSPIKHKNSIIEVMSYGCHYCALNEKDIEKFAATLPADITFEVIHINTGTSGLSVYAPVFATLEVMDLEPKMRGQIFNDVMKRGINLADENTLNLWLAENNIASEKYQQIRQSKAVAERLEYMAQISHLYEINATPLFIIDKKIVAAKDRPFPEFGDYMLQLLNQDKE